MKKFGADPHAMLARPATGTLRAAILACGFGSLAAFAQAPNGPREQADSGLAVSLDTVGTLYSGSEFQGVQAGQRITLVAAVTGATGAVRYDWDFDDDGVIDRSGTQSQVEATYGSEFAVDEDDYHDDWYGYYWAGEVSVRATDGAGNQARARVRLAISLPKLGVNDISPFTEMCGDGDAQKEPGERWRVAVIPYNFGVATTSEGYALLTPTDRLQAAVGGQSVVGAFALDRPAIPAGNLSSTVYGPNGLTLQEGAQSEVTVQIARNAPCGSRFEIRNDIGVDSAGSGRFNTASVSSFYVAPAAQCQVYTGCDESIAAVVPRQGLYFNPQRPGNGISVLLRQTAQGTTFFGAWFTGDSGHRPTWYIVQGYLSGNQVIAPIHRYTRRPGAAFAVDRTQVGNANVVILEREKLAFAFTLRNADGSDRPRVAELMTHIAPGAPAASDATGAYYAASEAGWGQVLSEYLGPNGADAALLVHFLYDAQGQPRWVLAAEPTSALASTHPYLSFPVHCPGCAWLPDWQTLRTEVGGGSFSLDGPGHARVSTQFALPADIGGAWQRNGLGVELLLGPN